MGPAQLASRAAPEKAWQAGRAESAGIWPLEPDLKW